MRKLLLLAGLGLWAWLAATAAPAMAWTHCGTPQAEPDCPPITVCINGVETEVPDNGMYQPGKCETPPPPPVCELPQVLGPDDVCVTPPPSVPPVQPPVTPPAQPPAPPADTPPDTHDTPVVPDDHDVGVPVKTEGPGIVAGKEQKGGSVEGPANTETVAAETGKLPFTGGAPLLPITVLGGTLLACGAAARRRLSS